MQMYEFWSECRQYGVIFSESVLEFMLADCRQSGLNETGGIVAGYYTPKLDCAVVTKVSKAPPDSKSGRTWFHRGRNGLQNWLNKLWFREAQYYLGEWHFHPFASAHPSYTDKHQMKTIATSQEAKCPEPLLLILGGDPQANWEIRVFVFPEKKQAIELVQTKTRLSSASSQVSSVSEMS